MLQFKLLLLPLLVSPFFVCRAQNLTSYVNPFIGTGNGAPGYSMGSAAGNTPPGAAYPFGMVLWSPDTTHDSGGYRWEHDTIHGFSVTHFSGRGIGCWQDLPIMPVPGSVGAVGTDHWNGYSSGFSHENEQASPGYYSVRLDNGAATELTVTQRTGMARFAFPQGGSGTVLINAAGSANGNWGSTWVALSGNRVLYGAATSGNCGGAFSYTVYFAVLFDRPASRSLTWDGNTGASLVFDTGENSVVQAKIGLSFVSFTNAYDNLSQENSGWDFDAVRVGTTAAWNKRLGVVEVEDGDANRKTIFYTALYHASIHPSTFSDRNGEYLGFDGTVHRTQRTQYHNIPAWDFSRSLASLLAITAPDVAADLVQSLVNDAQQDPGGGLPRWVHAAVDSCGMFGDGSSKIVATAWAFGARNFDLQGAYSAMLRGATQSSATASGCPVREDLDDYLTLGYVSTRMWGSAARTLEYAASDFAISRVAAALGDTAAHDQYLRRAQSWRNLLHNGYIVPRNPDGTFVTGFSPDGCVTDGYVEGSGAQYSFMVRHNTGGLFRAFGGNAAAVARLDRFFQQLNAGPCSEFAFMGNEPSLRTPWMYAFAGAPWKTQQTVRRILNDLYANSPGGMPGNDDGGVLSAWVVFSSLGLYPQIPGVGGLVIGSPLFAEAKVHLPSGGELAIHAQGTRRDTPYVQQLKLDGVEFARPWIPWAMLSNGAILDFRMGRAPVQDWGAAAGAAPPSFDVVDQ